MEQAIRARQEWRYTWQRLAQTGTRLAGDQAARALPDEHDLDELSVLAEAHREALETWRSSIREAKAALPASAAQSEERLLFSIPATAKLLSISRSLAYCLIQSGDLRTIHIGRRVLVPRAEIERIASTGVDTRL
jgi:excisionase family DNA binding protein